MDGLAHAHSLQLSMIVRVLASEVKKVYLPKPSKMKVSRVFCFMLYNFVGLSEEVVDMHWSLMYTSVSELVVYLPTDIVLLKFGFFCWGLV